MGGRGGRGGIQNNHNAANIIDQNPNHGYYQRGQGQRGRRNRNRNIVIYNLILLNEKDLYVCLYVTNISETERTILMQLHI